MSKIAIHPCALMVVFLTALAARAQTSALQPDLGDPNTRSQPELIEQRPAMVWPPQTGPSDYQLYEQAHECPCCGPVGGNGPVRMELFLNTGPSRPLEGDLIAHSIDTGWLVEGGGRVLFFNTAQDAAWNIDLGLSYIWNHGAHPLQTLFPANTVTTINPVTGAETSTIVNDPVTIDNLYRTYVSIGGGREWFLLGPQGNCPTNLNWIFGVDGGFRYGCAEVELHDFNIIPGQYTRTTDQLYGGYVGVHTDVEYHCKCCEYLFGLYFDWGGMLLRSGLLNNTLNDQHIYDVNFLVSTGIRF